ncbi:hypothetical protein HF521_010005 [Silurus meridionalis]|uniref:G-protein coupled receptors family 1 profile domain-containing protein n=2 Tax=Silurus meridionalis TaxID=175797 RepID=A0A8T0AIE8_SILME|nr:hypothetical protein HF521_010005 [Silurus meridionalis]
MRPHFGDQPRSAYVSMAMFEGNNSTDYYDLNYSSFIEGPCQKNTVITFEAKITPIIFILVTVFSCVGNALVLWVLIKYENLKSMTNAFLLNLAISDLVFTIGLPFWTFEFISGWTFGEVACKSIRFVFYLGFYSSLIFLTVMTIHRYVAVVHPLAVLLNRTTYYSIGISALIWFLSFGAATPYLIFSKVDISYHSDKPERYCTYSAHWNRGGTYMQNAFFLAAFFTIAFCYIRILGRLLRPTAHTRPKTVKLILCIVVTFYLGWAPYNISIFLSSLISFNVSPFNECHVSTMLDYVFHISRLLAFSHCCLNPVFYVFMGVKFRDHLKKALKTFCKQDEQPLDRRQSHLIYSNNEEMTSY